MSDYTPQVGDRVRVVIEGVVGSTDLPGFGVDLPAGEHSNGWPGEVWLGPKRRDALVKSIEKIEPPVVQFKPGDVVRRKGTSERVYVLGRDTYIVPRASSFAHGEWEYGKPGNRARSEFTSERYEKVDLSELTG